jgi:hypothetical protein
MLATGLDIGWIAKIGKYTVHSSVNSAGAVKSHFRAAMTADADIIVTGNLNHYDHTYRFGIALESESGKVKAEPGVWKRFQRRFDTFLWGFGLKGFSEAR